ncbi:MAG: HEPN domain-containing protein [Oligoflexia bacterium]|nr:HEPN domain-containing protein [Oligoflexia bacterium]
MNEAKKLEPFKKWEQLARDDLKMAELALVHGFYLQSMFHTQQMIEKCLKGLIILLKQEEPPCTHDLVKLYSKLSGQNFYQEHLNVAFSGLNPFYIHVRYPTYKDKLSENFTKDTVESTINFAKGVLKWVEQERK